MSVLADFLRQEGERLRAGESDRRSKQEEWCRAVQRLTDAIREWVRSADPGGLVRIEETKWPQVEDGYSKYEAPMLTLEFGSHKIWVVPVSRTAATTVRRTDAPERKADGYVVLSDDPLAPPSAGSPTGIRLFRIRDGGEDRWYIQNPLDAHATPFTREQFEAILVGLLR